MFGSIRIYLIAAALAVIVPGLLWYRHALIAQGQDECKAEYTASQAKALAELNQLQTAMREKERSTQQRIDRIVSQTQEIVANDDQKHRTELARIRAGTERLRERFTCPGAAVPAGAANPSAKLGDDTAARGLRPTDAANIIGIADQADGVARQLIACQKIIQELTQ